jgi:predicted nucleic acid-binding protein
MLVVADTSPVCYLVLIGSVEVLPAMFGRVLVPEAVMRELQDADAPAPLREWIRQPPAWLEVWPVSAVADSALARLHPGEHEAIRLAEEMRADLLLIDEKAGRAEAARRGLKVTGLLGILADAASQGSLDLPDAIERLRKTNFRASPRMLKAVLDRRAEFLKRKKT